MGSQIPRLFPPIPEPPAVNSESQRSGGIARALCIIALLDHSQNTISPFPSTASELFEELMSVIRCEHFVSTPIVPIIAMLISCAATSSATADDWGAYDIIPASASGTRSRGCGFRNNRRNRGLDRQTRPRPTRNG